MNKRVLGSIVTLVFLSFAGLLIADTVQSEFYYINVPVVKVYQSKLGYKVLYRTRGVTFYEAYIPNSWFSTSYDKDGKRIAPKAQKVEGHGDSIPYMTVYYLDGKFDHLRLFVDADQNSSTFGYLEDNDQNAKNFEVTDLTLNL